MELDISSCSRSLRNVFCDFRNNTNDGTIKELERELDASTFFISESIFKLYNVIRFIAIHAAVF